MEYKMLETNDPKIRTLDESEIADVSGGEDVPLFPIIVAVAMEYGLLKHVAK